MKYRPQRVYIAFSGETTNLGISYVVFYTSVSIICSMCTKLTAWTLLLAPLRGLIWLDQVCHFGHSLRNQNM